MESSALTPEEKFLKYHDRLKEELNWAHIHHEIYKTLDVVSKLCDSISTISR
jgi:hypothetical protein